MKETMRWILELANQEQVFIDHNIKISEVKNGFYN